MSIFGIAAQLDAVKDLAADRFDRLISVHEKLADAEVRKAKAAERMAAVESRRVDMEHEQHVERMARFDVLMTITGQLIQIGRLNAGIDHVDWAPRLSRPAAALLPHGARLVTPEDET